MMSLDQIVRDSHKAVYHAAREHRQPLTIWPQDIDGSVDFQSFCGHIPWLGDYKRPKGFKQVDLTEYLKGYPYRWFFVDSSGWGGEGESALTVSQFLTKLRELTDQHGFNFALGVVERGEFQVHIGLYTANGSH